MKWYAHRTWPLRADDGPESGRTLDENKVKLMYSPCGSSRCDIVASPASRIHLQDPAIVGHPHPAASDPGVQAGRPVRRALKDAVQPVLRRLLLRGER